MKTVVVYGQNHKGSTYHVARELVEKIGGETTEFFLPKDFGEFCVGCNTCFNITERKCPHYAKLAPITAALDAADVIILASPVYVYHATGAMKAFLDHYGYRWMVHSPEASMFTKQAVCVCTAAGAGMKTTLRDMHDSLFQWGIAKTYTYGVGVAAVDWAGVSEKKRRTIDKTTTKIAQQIVRRAGRVRPGIKTRMVFAAMSRLQRSGFNPRDVEHWKQHGWTEGKRPWKQ
ncbi:MAG: flavodoxin family protein [Atopobiaceae bacterium]|nr:flavodoxin family protein [Atopobiaceae bacterium]